MKEDILSYMKEVVDTRPYQTTDDLEKININIQKIIDEYTGVSSESKNRSLVRSSFGSSGGLYVVCCWKEKDDDELEYKEQKFVIIGEKDD